MVLFSCRLGVSHYYLPFPVRGRKLFFWEFFFALPDFDYYLPFPVRGRKRDTCWQCRLSLAWLLFTFPRKGTETVHAVLNSRSTQDYYLPFPVRGRKPGRKYQTRCSHRGLLFTFPRKGTETFVSFYTYRCFNLLLFTFPRKGTETSLETFRLISIFFIIIYLSP